MTETGNFTTRPVWNAERDGCQIGDIAIDRIVDLQHIPFAADLIYPDATPDILEELASRLDKVHFGERNTELCLSFHSYLVRTASQIILVDLCCGNNKNRPTRPHWHQRSGPFLENLASAGVTPEDVDIVMCTHLHADHVGWNTRLENNNWVPTFPNARYLFAEKEFKYWQALHDADPPEPVMYGSFEDSVLPVISSGQAEFVTGDHKIANGIYLEPAYGHTPGNVLIHAENNNKHAILCGDTIHHPVQLIHPEWSTNFCTDQSESRSTRQALLSDCAGSGSILLPAHFHSPEYGTIEKDGIGYRLLR